MGIFDRSLTVSVGSTLGSLSCCRSLQKTRLNLIQFWLFISSSFLLQTDESGKFLVGSNPVLSKDLLSHERNSLPSLNGRSDLLKLEHALIAENLWSFLEKLGACYSVIPCHIYRIWHNEVSCFVPFLHVSEYVRWG